MASSRLLGADLLVAAEIAPEQEQAIVDMFGDLGVAARSRAVPVQRASADLQWLLLAMLPLQAFLSTLGSTLADQAPQALMRLVDRARGTRRENASHPAVLVLQDAATRLQVVLEADLPARAYRTLLTLDLSAFRVGPLHYDRHRRAWRSELDEVQLREATPAAKPGAEQDSADG